MQRTRSLKKKMPPGRWHFLWGSIHRIQREKRIAAPLWGLAMTRKGHFATRPALCADPYFSALFVEHQLGVCGVRAVGRDQDEVPAREDAEEALAARFARKLGPKIGGIIV